MKKTDLDTYYKKVEARVEKMTKLFFYYCIIYEVAVVGKFNKILKISFFSYHIIRKSFPELVLSSEFEFRYWNTYSVWLNYQYLISKFRNFIFLCLKITDVVKQQLNAMQKKYVDLSSPYCNLGTTYIFFTFCSFAQFTLSIVLSYFSQIASFEKHSLYLNFALKI